MVSSQEYFKEMTDNDIRKRIYEEQKNQIEQDMAPFGFIEHWIRRYSVLLTKTEMYGILMNTETVLTCGITDDFSFTFQFKFS